MNRFFRKEDLGDGICVIRDLIDVEMYLIEGEEKALLLDTGIGIGDLKGFVSRLTDKPVEVYLTHGHVDHGGGIYGFDQVWIPEGDRELLAWHTTPEMRFGFACACVPKLKKLEGIGEQMPFGENVMLHTVHPGDEIDLGNRKIKVINLKGHTQGSTGYYDEQTKTLFAGDGCNNSTFLFLEESASVSEYRDMLLELRQEWIPKVERLMICHEYVSLPLRVVDELIECCDMVLENRATGPQFIMPFEPLRSPCSFWAARGEAHREVCDGKIGNLIYSALHIQ